MDDAKITTETCPRLDRDGGVEAVKDWIARLGEAGGCSHPDDLSDDRPLDGETGDYLFTPEAQELVRSDYEAAFEMVEEPNDVYVWTMNAEAGDDLDRPLEP